MFSLGTILESRGFSRGSSWIVSANLKCPLELQSAEMCHQALPRSADPVMPRIFSSASPMGSLAGSPKSGG